MQSSALKVRSFLFFWNVFTSSFVSFHCLSSSHQTCSLTSEIIFIHRDSERFYATTCRRGWGDSFLLFCIKNAATYLRKSLSTQGQMQASFEDCFTLDLCTLAFCFSHLFKSRVQKKIECYLAICCTTKS